MAERWKRSVKKATKKKKSFNLWIVYRLHYNDTDFNYRVKDERGKLAFGSSSIRDCANPSNYGVSRLAIAKNTWNVFDIGPGKYELKPTSNLPKHLSKIGYGGLALQSRRFSDDSPTAREKGKRWPNLHQYCPDICHLLLDGKGPTWPFKTQRKAFDWSSSSAAPEASIYFNGRTRDYSVKYLHCFGGKKDLKQHVIVKCSPYIADKCAICGTRFDTQDYWMFLNNFLCIPCMEEQRSSQSKFSSHQLDKFQKIRTCSFMHQHEGTTAKIPLKSRKELLEQTFHESYFSSYFNECGKPTLRIRCKKPKVKYGGRLNFAEKMKIQSLAIP